MKILRGFERVYFDVNQSEQGTFVLTQKDISHWNVVSQSWLVACGNYTVMVMTSANNANIKLQGFFTFDNLIYQSNKVLLDDDFSPKSIVSG